MSEALTRAYRAGVLAAEGFPLADVSEYLAEATAIVWVDLCDPTQQQLHDLAGELGLHELAVEDALGPHQRPKLDRYDTHLFLSCEAVAVDGPEGGLIETRPGVASPVGRAGPHRGSVADHVLVVHQVGHAGDAAAVCGEALHLARVGARWRRVHRPRRPRAVVHEAYGDAGGAALGEDVAQAPTEIVRQAQVVDRNLQGGGRSAEEVNPADRGIALPAGGDRQAQTSPTQRRVATRDCRIATCCSIRP